MSTTFAILSALIAWAIGYFGGRHALRQSLARRLGGRRDMKGMNGRYTFTYDQEYMTRLLVEDMQRTLGLKDGLSYNVDIHVNGDGKMHAVVNLAIMDTP